MTDPPLSAYPTRDQGGISTVSLTGELDLVRADQLRRHLIAQLDRPGTDTVVADLAQVTFLDSAALGALIGAYQYAGEVDRRFLVAGPVHGVRRIMEIAGVYEFLTGVG